MKRPSYCYWSLFVLWLVTTWVLPSGAMQGTLSEEERKQLLEDKIAEDAFEEELQKVLEEWARNGQKGSPEALFPATYSAKAIEAWVVDEDTGQPLEQTIVVAHWQLDPIWGHGSPVGQLTVLETVTDAKGRFYFPAWGPKPREPKSGLLTNDDPELFVFKKGYRGKKMSNRAMSIMLHKSLRSSDWDGKTIKLKRFADDNEEYAGFLRAFADELEELFFRKEDCTWKQIPRTLVALHLESKRLEAKHIRNGPDTIEEQDKSRSQTKDSKCGSMQTFLRSYLP